MSNDVMRLSDLVPEYASYYKVSPQIAAHALHELAEELNSEHSDVRGNSLLLNEVFWVGRAGSSQRSIRSYSLYFQQLSKYFYDFYNTPHGTDNEVLNCYSRGDEQFKNIPASAVYFSRAALEKWLIDAEIEVPGFLSEGNSRRRAEDDERKEFQTKELNSISLITSGLISLIKEVDKAHTEQPIDEAAMRRSDTIKRRALKLRSSRKSFDMGLAILALADAAGVAMPKTQKTLRKYMGDHYFRSADEK